MTNYKHDFITLFMISTDGVYASCDFTALDLEFDMNDFNYVQQNYTSWNTADADKEQIAEELAMNFKGETVHEDTDEWSRGWYLEFTQENIDEYLAGIEKDFSDDTGDMIYDPEQGWYTPQDFMRSVKPGTRYYICGAVDAYR